MFITETTMTEKQLLMAKGYEEMGRINLEIAESYMKFEGLDYLTASDKYNETHTVTKLKNRIGGCLK